MKKYLVIILLAFLPSIMWAQMPGGEIKRTVKKKTQRHSQNVVISKDSRLSTGQNSQTAGKVPSKEYLNLFRQLEKAFIEARHAYDQVKNHFSTPVLDRHISNYKSSEPKIKRLRGDSENYNLLSDKQKKEINDFFYLLDDIKRNYDSYPRSPQLDF